jgi:hypothetical protein
MAYHGFNGIEPEVVTKIAEWITRENTRLHAQDHEPSNQSMQADARGQVVGETSGSVTARR